MQMISVTVEIQALCYLNENYDSSFYLHSCQGATYGRHFFTASKIRKCAEYQKICSRIIPLKCSGRDSQLLALMCDCLRACLCNGIIFYWIVLNKKIICTGWVTHDTVTGAILCHLEAAVWQRALPQLPLFIWLLHTRLYLGSEKCSRPCSGTKAAKGQLSMHWNSEYESTVLPHK